MKKLDNYINYIETVLINKNIDTEDTEWKQKSELNKLINPTEDIYIIDSVTLGIDAPELLLMVKIKSSTISNDIVSNVKNNILNKIKKIKNSNTFDTNQDIFRIINVLFFVSNIDTRVNLKNAFMTQNISDLSKDIKKSTGFKKIKINTVFYLDKDVSLEEIKIPNVRRYEMVTMPALNIDVEIPQKKSSNSLKGYVFTANLFDIVSLYNAVGDQLFRKNVRLGIDDKLDVDKSIQETLKDKPDAFWFRNNGITILVEEPDWKLDRVGEIILKGNNKTELCFSIINGAQTITAASEYYYSLAIKDRAKIASTAKVIVKIIHIQNSNRKEAEKEAKNISISLNRQKPIKAEDIAFTNDFVEIMNNYLESSKSNYILVRRGEEQVSNSKVYSLINFAKARKACSGDPGSARSNSTATLLKITTETSQFHDTNIFVPQWYSATEDEKESIFNMYYSPVLFAMDLAEKCQSFSKKPTATGAVANVISNGMWYFIAYIVYVLNNGNDNDYSNFSYNADKITADKLKDLFEQFAGFYCKKLNANESDTISNIFKKSEKYMDLKRCRYKNSTFYRSVCKLFGKSQSKSYTIKPANTHRDISSSNISTINSNIQVSFNGANKYVENITDAFIYTIQQCLNNTSTINIFNALSTLSFLTSDNSIESGFFTSKELIVVQGINIYLGKRSTNNIKMRQLTKLCDLIYIKPKTIMWKDKNTIIFEY